MRQVSKQDAHGGLNGQHILNSFINQAIKLFLVPYYCCDLGNSAGDLRTQSIPLPSNLGKLFLLLKFFPFELLSFPLSLQPSFIETRSPNCLRKTFQLWILI